MHVMVTLRWSVQEETRKRAGEKEEREKHEDFEASLVLRIADVDPLIVSHDAD
jgi:hypothetical protein